MNWLLIALIALVLLLAFLAWVFYRITKRAADAAALLLKVEEKSIPALVDECVRVAREKLGTELKLTDLQNSAEGLDYLLDPQRRSHAKSAFATSDHPGRFVMPMGAFLGELVRTHNPGSRWVTRQGGGLAMEIPRDSSTWTMHPFDKVLKHAATGARGELVAYVSEAVGSLPKGKE